MRRFSFATAVVTVTGMILVAGACSSVPEVTFGGQPGTDSSTSSSGSSSGSASSSGTPTDGPSDVVSDCTPTGPEVCDDGIDNDCNAKIDCADDACKPGNECVDPAPAGWTLVSFADLASSPACGAGYETPIDLKVVDGTGTGTCSCACAPTAGTACNAATFAVRIDTSDCSATAINLAPNANCTQLPNVVAIPGGNTVVASATPPAGPSACADAVTAPGGPVRPARACSVASSTKFGKGCGTAAQLCAPKAPGFEACVTKLGSEACPAPYTARLTAGTATVDTRLCDTCACEAKGCAGTVELFSEAHCTAGTGNKRSTGAIDASCTDVTDKAFTATRYKTSLAAGFNGCGIDAAGFDPAMTGDIQWTEQRTVCCKP